MGPRLRSVAFCICTGSLLLLSSSAIADAQTLKRRQQMLVSTEWLAQHLQDPGLVVLCIGGKDFCDSGRIPGARQIALNEISTSRNGVPAELPEPEVLQRVFEAAGITEDSRVVLYGERAGLFAARAYFSLDYLGAADRAALLDGGLAKWKAEGRPLAGEAPHVTAGKLTIKLKPEVLLSLSEMQRVVQGAPASAAIVDARPADEFSGAKVSEETSKAGHIPHAAGIFWMNLLKSPRDPVLLPEAELRHLFVAAGATPDRPVVTYCRTGMQASVDYFVAKYLGYKAALYDGSFYEWSRQDLPVETATKAR